jgi:L-threonylcarbamoyladenylate synthase
MSASLIKIDPARYDPELVREARESILGGGVVVFPTETFYGLGASAFSASGVKKIYALKDRDQGKPLSIVVADLAAAEVCIEYPPVAFFDLARRFWPGPLTLVLRARPLFPEEMLGEGRTIAMRVPGMAWLQSFLKDLGVPLTATSANRSGGEEIADPARILAEFQEKDVTIIAGGPTPGGLSSTIVDLTVDPPKILREGAIPTSRIWPD